MRKLTLTKRAPASPPIIPKPTATGMPYYSGIGSTCALPNFVAEPCIAVKSLKSAPCAKVCKMSRMSVAKEHVINVRQISSKCYNSLDFDSSYENIAPPMGAPNAAAAPAEAPPEIKLCLRWSLRMNSKPRPGMYGTAAPQIEPI